MKKILFCVFLTMRLFADAQTIQPISTYTIPSGGATVTLPNYQVTRQVNLTCNGATTLSAGYTLAYTSLPSLGSVWSLYCDFSQLNASGQQVNVFGIAPLDSFPNTTRFYLNYWVAYNAGGTPTLYHQFVPSLADLATNNNPAIFNNTLTANGALISNAGLYANAGVRFELGSHSPNQTVSATDSSGNLAWGCVPYCITGNAGLTIANYIGSSDTSGVNFGWDGLQSGRIDGNLGNAFFGLDAGHKNTSGTSNTAIGALSMNANTTGQNNASFGTGTMLANTTGSYNTALGQDALPANTTGSYNTAVGQGSLITNTTGSYNSTLGYNVNPNSATVHNGIGIGANAVYSTNQCAIAGVENLYLNGTNNHVGYALIDTSGTGNFVPQPVPNTTPLIDTVTGTSSQTFTLSNNQTNILKASTTVTGAVLAFPAAQSGTIYVIWGIQTTTTTISGTNTGGCTIPSTVAAGVSRKFVNLNGNWE